MMPQIPVMQLIDSLAIGGAERMAVNIANHLPQATFTSYLCVTRQGGPLKAELAPHVQYLEFGRKARWDLAALQKLRAFINEQQIQIIHAHSSSLFIARLASLNTGARVLWHDHYGRQLEAERPVGLYRLATHQVAGAIVVSQTLRAWALNKLQLPDAKVFYIPNFVVANSDQAPAGELDYPGTRLNRLVCVANLRPQKDHLNLIRAVALVHKAVPIHLLLVGSYKDAEYYASIQAEIAYHKLQDIVHILGERNDVYQILQASTIGVLSSKSEGLPLALLEYGISGLPSIATAVGECPQVLLDGKVGILVEPQNPEQLAEALLQLLQDPAYRSELATKFQAHVMETYSNTAIIDKICAIYNFLLTSTKVTV